MALAVALVAEADAEGDADADADVGAAAGADGSVSFGTGAAEVLPNAVPPSARGTSVDEEAAAQPTAPQASSTVKARNGHLTDRVRILAGLLGSPGAVISGDIVKKRRT